MPSTSMSTTRTKKGAGLLPHPGREPRCVTRQHPQGVPPAGPQVPPGHQSRRSRCGGTIQGDPGGLPGTERSGQAQGVRPDRACRFCLRARRRARFRRIRLPEVVFTRRLAVPFSRPFLRPFPRAFFSFLASTARERPGAWSHCSFSGRAQRKPHPRQCHQGRALWPLPRFGKHLSRPRQALLTMRRQR